MDKVGKRQWTMTFSKKSQNLLFSKNKFLNKFDKKLIKL